MCLLSVEISRDWYMKVYSNDKQHFTMSFFEKKLHVAKKRKNVVLQIDVNVGIVHMMMMMPRIIPTKAYEELKNNAANLLAMKCVRKSFKRNNHAYVVRDFLLNTLQCCRII
ncbi:CLUMA_CG019327, isoform A [Clunio marinus]|uniref:CLUMA_CG019327, isoform A n=1 Tax=Clunio marinus TaxID=568069 RepID=A0A1J1J0Z2_9DIPT|nr:CLUMA_CG019327, isoform A [Clunio marinus]